MVDRKRGSKNETDKRARRMLQAEVDGELHEATAKFASLIRDVDGKPFDRSCYVRDLLRFDMAVWQQSPYTITQSSNFLLVTRDGSFVFHRVEDLMLNQDLDMVSAKIEMKVTHLRGA